VIGEIAIPALRAGIAISPVIIKITSGQRRDAPQNDFGDERHAVDAFGQNIALRLLVRPAPDDMSCPL
ncbi:MAG TPA: hypothetical protein PLQ83_15760, partial [Thermoflexales bacterium]|nr:hypothetical protein [Thermoflexales bacterium]